MSFRQLPNQAATTILVMLDFLEPPGGAEMGTRTYGRHIVSNPRICHGKPAFRRSGILVSDILEQVAEGPARESIIEQWRGRITRDAIAEALHLSTQAFPEHANEYARESSAG